MKVELGKTCLLTEQTYRMVADYYIYYYNNLRPYSTLGYRPSSLRNCHFIFSFLSKSLSQLCPAFIRVCS